MLAIIRHIIFTLACNEDVKMGKTRISARKIFNHYLKMSNNKKTTKKKLELFAIPRVSVANQVPTAQLSSTASCLV